MMRRSILITLFLAIMFTLVLAPSSEDAASADNTATHTQVSRSNENGLTFTLQVANPSIGADGSVAVAGLEGRMTTSGAPDLPFYSTLIALPPEANAKASVNIVQASTTSVSSVLPFPSVANTDKLLEDDVIIKSIEDDLGLEYIKDADIYGKSAAYPGLNFELSEPMYMRDLRVVKLTLYPLQYNPVAGTLTTANEIAVNLTFTGGNTTTHRQTAPTVNPTALSSQLINSQLAENWRALPQASQTVPTISVPNDRNSFKIEVDQSGIYEIDYADLQAAGLGQVNPANIQMMHDGLDVAYQFIGDSDEFFEAGETIRFYGWAFDGTRHDKIYVSNNVYWLWADGVANNIQTIANPTGYAPATHWESTVTKEPENIFSTTYSNQWDTYDNEGDSWYWERIRRTSGVTNTYEVELPNPANTTDIANFTVEVTSRSGVSDHLLYVSANGGPRSFETWDSVRNVNINGTVQQSDLLNGANEVDIHLATVDGVGNFVSEDIYLNRISFTYARQFAAENDQLIFSYKRSGNDEFNVTNFSEGDANNVVVWEITNRYAPAQIPIMQADISGGVAKTYRIGSDHAANAQYIATTNTNILEPVSITPYKGKIIEPQNGADWLAITNGAFYAEVERLAAHRVAYNGISTHIVNAEDVFAQYGNGFETPAALQEYISNAILQWETPPSYLLLVGDATQDPRQVECPLCSWAPYAEATFLITDMQFADRFQGLVPTDHTFATLVGDDEIPDIALGRFAAQTSDEVRNMVDKVIEYDLSVQAGEAWLDNILFASDNVDSGGNFCFENQSVNLNYVPASFVDTQLCLDTYLTDNNGDPVDQATAKTQMRVDFFNEVNVNGDAIVNYRGHGSIQYWAGGLMHRDNSPQWLNNGRPPILLSADCLDGHFAWPDREALSETFMQQGDLRGTAAHWSSTGLGYSFEHTALHTQFYAATYTQGLTAIGDAITYAKARYIGNQSGSIAEIYTFVLQGDPAMTMPAEPGTDRIGVAVDAEGNNATTMPGTTVTYEFDVVNNGVGSDSFTLSIGNNQWPSTLSSSSTGMLSVGQSTTVRLTVDVPAGATGNDIDLAHVTILSDGDGSTSKQAAFATTAELVVAVDASPDSTLIMQQGTSRNTYVTVTNTGNRTDTFNLSVSPGWGASIAPTVLTLAPGSSAEVAISLTAPAGTAIGTSQAVTLTAVSAHDGVTSDAATITAMVDFYRLRLPILAR